MDEPAALTNSSITTNAVVLIMGAFATRRHFDELADFLASKGCAVLSYIAVLVRAHAATPLKHKLVSCWPMNVWHCVITYLVGLHPYTFMELAWADALHSMSPSRFSVFPVSSRCTWQSQHVVIATPAMDMEVFGTEFNCQVQLPGNDQGFGTKVFRCCIPGYDKQQRRWQKYAGKMGRKVDKGVYRFVQL